MTTSTLTSPWHMMSGGTVSNVTNSLIHVSSRRVEKLEYVYELVSQCRKARVGESQCRFSSKLVRQDLRTGIGSREPWSWRVPTTLWRTSDPKHYEAIVRPKMIEVPERTRRVGVGKQSTRNRCLDIGLVFSSIIRNFNKWVDFSDPSIYNDASLQSHAH